MKPRKSHFNVILFLFSFSVQLAEFVLLICLIFTDYVCHRNLLRPTGVGLQEAVFTLKVYRAEDLPQSKIIVLLISVRALIPMFAYKR